MKRILTMFLSALLLTAALCIPASASDYDSAAKDLSAIGMFRGTASGFELDRAPTRSEAAIMLVRLYGAEDAAKAAYDSGEITHPFTDVSAFTAPYVAWLYTKGLTNGATATTFGSAGQCSVKQYCAFLLRALGYQDGTDFAYDDTLTFAQSKGLYDSSMFTATFLRDDLAAITYQALATDLADGSTYLLSSLVKSGAIDAKAAAPMTEKMEGYRALLSATTDVMGNSMDADINANMKIDMSATGTENGQPVSEQQAMDMVMSGNMKMILSASPQIAYTLKSTVMGETMDISLWMKDGWVYTRSGETAYKYQVADQLGAYEELMESNLSQMNVGLLPMIDSISATKSGATTVYTLAMGDSMSGLVNDALSMAGMEDQLGLGMDMQINSCTYTYTITNGQLKTMTAVMDAAMQMAMDDGAGNAIAVDATYAINMDMKVNATGDAVHISYPDFSGFPVLDPSASPDLTA